MTRINACVYQSYIQQQLAGIFSRFKISELNNCEFKIQRNFTSHWLFAINISQKISDTGELEGNSFLTYYFVNKTLKHGDRCLVLPTLAQDQAAEQFGESVNILFVPKYTNVKFNIYSCFFLNLQSNDLCANWVLTDCEWFRSVMLIYLLGVSTCDL